MATKPCLWATLDPFIEPGPVLGRKVANREFLDALLRADPYDGYHFYVPDEDSGRCLDGHLRTLHGGVRNKIRILPRQALSAGIASTPYHCFHLSDCLTSPGYLTAARNRLSCVQFPVTGVTHSLSYARYGPLFAQHIWAGAGPRDAIVATSRAGASVVRAELDGLATLVPGSGLPSVEVIPLGVRCAGPNPGQLSVEVPEDKTVVLIPGRISPYSKMDLLPVLRAFQRLRVAGEDLDGLCLILAGNPDEGDALPGTLRNLAANIGLELLVIACPDDRERDALLARADVVLSLADNPQETFGLTVLEAAAAGRPVIASDYDGYRDLIRHGETGLLVPTLDSGCTDEISLLAPLLFDSTCHLWLAQDVAVDVEALAQALRVMLCREERERMGAAAREHAQDFDWSVIVARYVRLWEELWQRPLGTQASLHPLSLDYGRIFAAYPTRRITDADLLESTDLGRAVYRGQDFPVVYAGLEDRVDLGLMRRMLVWTRHPLTVGALLERSGPGAMSTLMWMLKNDMLRRVTRV